MNEFHPTSIDAFRGIVSIFERAFMTRLKSDPALFDELKQQLSVNPSFNVWFDEWMAKLQMDTYQMVFAVGVQNLLADHLANMVMGMELKELPSGNVLITHRVDFGDPGLEEPFNHK